MMTCRMYACVRALIFGEDFTTDPVSQGLGFALRYFSGGAIALNVPLVSQVHSGILFISMQTQLCPTPTSISQGSASCVAVDLIQAV